jgi:outer membrane lipopolysaccharide assembly protein LptE/RlpB
MSRLFAFIRWLTVLSLGGYLCLTACGFHLRGEINRPTFQTLYVQGSSEMGVLGSLRRLLGPQGIRVENNVPITALFPSSEPAGLVSFAASAAVKTAKASQVSQVAKASKASAASASASALALAPSSALILLITNERFQRTIVGTTPAGGIRAVELQIDLTFSVFNVNGEELIVPTPLVKRAPLTYNETVALSKEEEQAQLTRMMRDDLADLLVRRMALASSAPQ